MKYAYSVVRFVPDPVRGEYVNVGVVAGSDDASEWQLRTLENQKRARSLDDKGLLPLVWGFIDDIGRKIDQYDEAVQTSLFEVEDEKPSEKWLEQLSLESRNVIQLSEPAVVVAESVDEALDILFGQFIIEPEARRFPYKKKHPALAAIRRSYREAGLEIQKHFEERAYVMGRHHKERFDFVVANGQAVQLAQTWSFQMPDQEELSEQIKAWAWTVGDVRENGGVAELASKRIQVPPDVEIEVVYVPPAFDGSRDALTEALAAFKKIDVQPVEYEQAESIGQQASKLIAARSQGGFE